MAETFLIVGLGNPGKQYQNTRHNAGFMAVDALARALNAYFEPWRGDLALAAKTEAEGKTIYLLKPQTFMNLSGQAVSAFANFYKIPPSAVLVIFDDMSLPLGSIRLRKDGSAGGQNGMQNIIELAGTQNIARLRIGIGPRPAYFEGKDFVLSKFSAQEQEVLSSALQKAKEAVSAMLSKGIEQAMTEANRKES